MKNLVFLYKIAFFIVLIQFTLQKDFFTIHRELSQTKPEVDCTEEPFLKHFQISTNYNEDSDIFNIPIYNDCMVAPMWVARENQYSQCIITERVFEGEDNIRRAFRFSNTKAPGAQKLHIKEIHLYYDKLIADSAITEKSFTLSPGETKDIYIDYECFDKDENRSLSTPWYNMKIQVEFENDKVVNFEMIKICTATYTGKLDFSHLFIIIIGLLIIYFSAQDYLKSDMEVALLDKFHEMRNPENLTLMTLIIALLFIFLGVIGKFPIFAYYISIATGILSFALVVQAVCHKANFGTSLDSASYEITYIGSISILFLIGLGVGVFLVYLWTVSKNWFLGDLIAIAIAFIIIRLFRLTSFKWILGIYIAAYIYNVLWTKHHSNYFGENYKLTTFSPIPLPVKIICPELSSSPFKACSYISIADIVLPGLLLTYSKMFDILHNSNELYFNAGFGGLAAGLIIDVIVYYYKNLPTPCFLYTGPIILLVTFAIAVSRGEVMEYVNGFASNVFENKSLRKGSDFLKDNLEKIAGEYEPPGNENAYELKNRSDSLDDGERAKKRKVKNPYETD
jgi:hypothetical protein